MLFESKFTIALKLSTTIQETIQTIQDTTNSNINYIYLPLKNLSVDIFLAKRLLHWFEKLKNYGKWYYRVLGPLIDLKDKLMATKQRWFKGIKAWANRGNDIISTA